MNNGYDGYELVRKDGKVIANYPIIVLEQLQDDFKKICRTSDFEDYDSLDDFIDSIYFLEFLEYFLDYLHIFYPDVISYEKDISKMTKHESFIITTSSFGKLIHYAYRFLFFNDNIQLLFDGVKFEYEKLVNTKIFDQKEKQLLLHLYLGFLCFLELLIHKGKLDNGMSLLIVLKNNVIKGKINKTKPMFNQSTFSGIFDLFTTENIMKYRKNLLYKFKLFQRKYLSAIAISRRIGPPNITKEESKKRKKELNKNTDLDSNKMYYKYVLEKVEDESIYDYLAGIHKNSSGEIIHKNFNNNTVKKTKVNTKKEHHKSYVEKSNVILEMVEEKIEKHKDIIPKQIKNEVLRIRKLFDSNEYKNTNITTLSFGNNTNNTNKIGFGGKIIQDCKRIRALNNEIDKVVIQHQKMSKEVNKLIS